MLGGVDTIALALVGEAVEIAVNGNEKDMESKVGKSSLSAKILFNGEYIEGYHQGSRAVCGGERTINSMMLKQFYIEASGLGQFNSPELAYHGHFYKGKFHDLTGEAKCSFGTTQRYTGGFQEGHLSGHGVLEASVDGAWHKVYEGSWKNSKPLTGTRFDGSGKTMMTMREGTLTSIAGGARKMIAGRNRATLPPLSTSLPLVDERLSIGDGSISPLIAGYQYPTATSPTSPVIVVDIGGGGADRMRSASHVPDISNNGSFATHGSPVATVELLDVGADRRWERSRWFLVLLVVSLISMAFVGTFSPGFHQLLDEGEIGAPLIEESTLNVADAINFSDVTLSALSPTSTTAPEGDDVPPTSNPVDACLLPSEIVASLLDQSGVTDRPDEHDSSVSSPPIDVVLPQQPPAVVGDDVSDLVESHHDADVALSVDSQDNGGKYRSLLSDIDSEEAERETSFMIGDHVVTALHARFGACCVIVVLLLLCAAKCTQCRMLLDWCRGDIFHFGQHNPSHSTLTTEQQSFHHECPAARAMPMSDLIKSRLSDPDMKLKLEDSLAVLKECIELGRENAQQITGKDKTVVMVMGNTGAGKSTFLNYLAGCSMQSVKASSLGVTGALHHVVVVKPLSAGGNRDELTVIGHGNVSQTFIPNVLVDNVTELCFCDCPGFLDNRGAEINIANAVNMITTLSNAKEVKVIVLFSHKSVDADRGRGLADLIGVCVKLFGSEDNLKQHLDSMLFGCTQFDPKHTLQDAKDNLTAQRPAIMVDIVKRMFLIDVLASHEQWWDRATCIDEIRALPAIANPASVFHIALLASDEKKLIDMGMEITKRVGRCLIERNYGEARDLYNTLRELSVIKHYTVVQIVSDCHQAVCNHFMDIANRIREHCHFADFPAAIVLMKVLKTAAMSFQGDPWVEVLSLDQLKLYFVRAQERHRDQMQRDKDLKAKIDQAGNRINILKAALSAQKKEAVRKGNILQEQYLSMKAELAKQVKAAAALFSTSQETLRRDFQEQVSKKSEQEAEPLKAEYDARVQAAERRYAEEEALRVKKEQALSLQQSRVMQDVINEQLAVEAKMMAIASSSSTTAPVRSAEAPSAPSASACGTADEKSRSHKHKKPTESSQLKSADVELHAVSGALTKGVDSCVPHGDELTTCPSQLSSDLDQLDSQLENEVNLHDILAQLAVYNDGNTVLLKKHSSPTDINQLYSVGFESCVGNTEMTALCIASCNNQLEAVLTLLQSDQIDVNWRDPRDQRTALVWASYFGHDKVVKALIDHGASVVNVYDRDGMTALMWACYSGHTDVVKALLGDCAIADMINAEGITALMMACSAGHYATVDAFVWHRPARKFDVNTQDQNGYTALMWACESESDFTVSMLLTDELVNANKQNARGCTALMLASDTETVKVLLNAKDKLGTFRVDVTLKDKKGKTALFHAANDNIKALIRSRSFGGCTIA